MSVNVIFSSWAFLSIWFLSSTCVCVLPGECLQLVQLSWIHRLNWISDLIIEVLNDTLSRSSNVHLLALKETVCFLQQMLIYASEHENEMWEHEKMYNGFQAKILNWKGSWALNQNIRMISKKSCNIENWINGFFKILISNCNNITFFYVFFLIKSIKISYKF